MKTLVSAALSMMLCCSVAQKVTAQEAPPPRGLLEVL